MNAFLMQNAPYLIAGLVLVVALFLLIGRRRHRIDLGGIDGDPAPTLTRNSQAGVASPIVATADSDLLKVKGLGPRAAASLQALGVARLSDLAALDPDRQAEVDAQLGSFAGRLIRDQWVEQARLIENGDIVAFEARFGKLG